MPFRRDNGHPKPLYTMHYHKRLLQNFRRNVIIPVLEIFEFNGDTSVFLHSFQRKVCHKTCWVDRLRFLSRYIIHTLYFPPSFIFIWKHGHTSLIVLFFSFPTYHEHSGTTKKVILKINEVAGSNPAGSSCSSSSVSFGKHIPRKRGHLKRFHCWICNWRASSHSV